jgi:Ser/Thr protein kinase RdoA (MazF antagonist)
VRTREAGNRPAAAQEASRREAAAQEASRRPAGAELPTVSSANAVLREARRRFGLGADVTVSWLGQSENTTYLVRYPDATKAILRIGRLGYHTHDEVATELLWMTRLAQTTDLVIPQAIPGTDGQQVQSISHPQTGALHHCVMFEFVEGISPDKLSRQQFIDQFQKLGEITALLHLDVLSWPESASLSRASWDYDDLVGPEARLSSWEMSPCLGRQDRSIIKQALAVVRSRLAAYGKSPSRYGLIHSDLRCANLLVNGGQTALIDFDDSGFGYFMYDFGAAVTFIEDHPDIRQLLKAWVRGYRRHRPLGHDDVDEIKTFVLLRRICIHGWTVSHWEADDVRNGVGLNHDRVTVDLAQRYLQAVANDELIW